MSWMVPLSLHRSAPPSPPLHLRALLMSSSPPPQRLINPRCFRCWCSWSRVRKKV